MSKNSSSRKNPRWEWRGASKPSKMERVLEAYRSGAGNSKEAAESSGIDLRTCSTCTTLLRRRGLIRQKKRVKRVFAEGEPMQEYEFVQQEES